VNIVEPIKPYPIKYWQLRIIPLKPGRLIPAYFITHQRGVPIGRGSLRAQYLALSFSPGEMGTSTKRAENAARWKIHYKWRF